ncbi:MAG: ATP-binding protein [Pseudomonadota bacterium]|nr:ATP-binding protein [Pseudomonadota bacterium]
MANQACRHGHSALHVRLSRLLADLALGRGDGYDKTLAKLAKTEVLVIDEWALPKLTDEGRRDLLKIFDERHQAGSTIIASQLPQETWHESIGAPPPCRRHP